MSRGTRPEAVAKIRYEFHGAEMERVLAVGDRASLAVFAAAFNEQHQTDACFVEDYDSSRMNAAARQAQQVSERMVSDIHALVPAELPGSLRSRDQALLTEYRREA